MTGLVYTEPSALGSAEAVGGVGGSAFAAFALGQQVIVDSARNLTYAAYFDGGGVLAVAERSAAGEWSTTHPSVNGSTIVLQSADDSHNAVSIALDDTGALHLTGATHNKPMLYWRAATPGVITDLTFHATLNNPSAEGAITYSTFFNDKNGQLYLQFRNGQSGAGNGYLYRYDSATQTWVNPSPAGTLFNGAIEKGPNGHYFENTPNNYSAYTTVPVYDATSDLYAMAWMWRGDSSSADTNTRLSYAWSRDLITWYPMQTSTSLPTDPLTLPFRYTDTRTTVEELPNDGFPATPQIAFDSSHRPVLTYVKNNSNLDTKLYTARPTGPFNSTASTWRISDVTATPNSETNVIGDPTSTYISAWTGRIDTNATTLFQSKPMTINPDAKMTIRYDCNGQSRRIIITNTGTSGVSHLVSDGFDTNRTVPLSISQRSSTYSAYNLATRTVESASFTVPDGGYAPGVAAGTAAHWVMRWESGPYVSNATWPAPGTYPGSGTALTVQLVAG